MKAMLSVYISLARGTQKLQNALLVLAYRLIPLRALNIWAKSEVRYAPALWSYMAFRRLIFAHEGARVTVRTISLLIPCDAASNSKCVLAIPLPYIHSEVISYKCRCGVRRWIVRDEPPQIINARGIYT